MPEGNIKERKNIEEFITTYIDKIDPSGTNGDRYRTMFSKMNNTEFDGFMLDIKERKRKIVLYVPNMKITLRINNLKKVASELNILLEEQLEIYDPATKRYITTPNKYIIIYVPIRRTKQFLFDKISIPESDTTTDLLTGQVVKPDKGSTISLVELQIILDKNLIDSSTELMRIRGGDIHAYAAFKSALEEKGSVSLQDIDESSRVRSSVIASTYFYSMHIDNNI